MLSVLQYSYSIMSCLWVKCPTWNCCGWEERSIMCTCECVCACVWVFINIWGSRCWELFFLGMNTFCISGKRWDISCCNLLWAAAKDSFYCFTRRGPSQGPSLVLIAPGYCSAKWWRDLISWKYFGKRVIREKQKQKPLKFKNVLIACETGIRGSKLHLTTLIFECRILIGKVGLELEY